MTEQEMFLPPESAQTKHPYAKVLVVVILVLFFVTLLAQFRSSFRGYDKRVAGVTILSAEERAKNEKEALKKADTDGDGLSDYDELNLYHTSPYIKDTDSDGIPDGEEIKNGTDPLCPAGKDCSINTVVAGVASSTIPQPVTTLSQPGTATFAPAPTSTQAAPATSQFTPAQIREALIANGVPKEKVDALSDAELLKLLQEAQAEAGQPPKQ